MPYTHVTFYFYTGTGNSYRAATWMAEQAREAGTPASVVPIAEALPAQEVSPGALMGLFCPTHGFTAPWSMLRFALHLPPGHGVDALIVLCRAGMLFGKLLTPGFEGSGAYLLALILTLKGYRVRGSMGLDMPGTWTTLFPGFSQPIAEKICQRVRPRANAYFARILNGGTCFKGIGVFLLGLLVLPISFLYLILGRFGIAKLNYASPRCNGCGQCARTCPLHGVIMKKGRPYWTLSCESCTRCVNFCPQQAVEVSYPFAVLLIWITNLPFAAWLMHLLSNRVSAAAGWQGAWVEWVIGYPFQIVSVVFSYWLFWQLIRVPMVNRVVTFLTPTRFYRRYHTPGVKLSDLTHKHD